MKKDDMIQRSIDESLNSVRFSQQDMRRVLRATRQESAVRRAPQPRRSVRLQPIFAAMAAVMVIVPLSLFAVRTLRAGSSITIITPTLTSAGEPDPRTGDPIIGEDPLLPPQNISDRSAPVTENDAILAARACFEAQCDTSIFSFEEYTVSVQAEFAYGSDPSAPDYAVTMNSVYDNGCSFTVVVSGKDASVLSFSEPRLATVPENVDAGSAEIQAWYDKYGPYIFTWPLETQAEFSRRYEGGMLRMPREDEADQQTIFNRFGLHVHELRELTGESNISYYAMLYDGQSFSDGQARYHVYCFPGGEIADTLPDVWMRLTFLAADGAYESGEILSADDL